MRSTFLMALLCTVSVLPLLAQQPETSEVLLSRVRAAKKVVVGNVVDVQARFERNRFGDQLIVSEVHLVVDETLKGTGEGFVAVTIEGGTIGDVTLRVSDMPTVKTGDRLLALLDEQATGKYVPHGRGHGLLKLDPSNRIESSALTLSSVRTAIRTGK